MAGRYSLERELGRGGMGIVYLARDVRLDRPVALKLLPPERATSAAMRERFLSEARMAAGLAHPNIVPIHAVEELGPFVFFAMQYVAGETLGDRIRREGRLAPWPAATLLRDVAWALAYAHAQGVVHCDIKPDNILLDGDGRALVADFGIARLADHEGDGRVQGTPEYLSPEQAAGEPCDARSDLYALGAVAFHALIGQPPFAGDATALLHQHLTSPAPSLVDHAPELPARLSAAVDRALLKDPTLRWPSAETMAEAFAPPLPLTADLPVPVRIWAERGREMKGLYVIWSLLFYGLAIMVFTAASGPAQWPLTAKIIFSFFVMAIPVPWVGHAIWRLVETRRALEAGATLEDLRHASEVTRARREEEMRFDAARPIHWIARMVRVATYGAFVVAVAALVIGTRGATFFWNTPWAALFSVSTLMGITGALKGLLIPGRRIKPVDRWARLRTWFWSGPLGRLFARAAALGLPKAESGWASWRPTEAALGGATETLYQALGAGQQRQLDDLPLVVARLEHEAAHARAQLAGGVEGEWGDRLQAAVGAIETLRLGLLRIHAQMSDAGSLTADLDAARELASRIDYLLEAEDEVQAALARPRSAKAPVTPSRSLG